MLTSPQELGDELKLPVILEDVRAFEAVVDVPVQAFQHKCGPAEVLDAGIAELRQQCFLLEGQCLALLDHGLLDSQGSLEMNARLRSPSSHSLNNEDLHSCFVLVGVVGADLLVDLGSDQVLHADPVLKREQQAFHGKVEMIAAVDPSQLDEGQRLGDLPYLQGGV